MKKKIYKVTIYLDEEKAIKSTDCECPRGKFKCSHAAALFIHGIYKLSRTDIECQWRKRKATNVPLPSVQEMFPPAKPGYRALSRDPSCEERSDFFHKLKNYGKFTGLYWLMSPEPETQSGSLPVATVDEVIFQEEFLQLQGAGVQRQYFLERVKVDWRTIEDVSRLTSGQRDNPSWQMIRKGRLTASNFGSVLNVKRVTPSLIKRLLGEYDLSRVKAVQWGVTNESEALKAFTMKTGLAVVETGVWLHESGVLGASPDGLVGDESVLEAKCPYTQRDMTIEEAFESNNFCLEKKDGKTVLKRDHVYWHQVQGHMYFTKRKKCFFVVWTLKDFIVLEIQRDDGWEVRIQELKDFYLKHLFPKIIEGEL